MMKFTIIVIIVMFRPSLVASEDGNIILNERIIGGYTANDGQFPYQVSIRVNNKHNCGGSIISNFWILTAGHCIFGFSLESLRVVVGTNYVSYGGLVYKVVQGIVHERYKPDTLPNDIALLQVEVPIFYSIKIQPIWLATIPLPPGTICVVSGWGWISYEDKTIPDYLQYLDQKLVDTNECKKYYIEKPNEVLDTNVCAVNGHGRGVCHADSGGPLVCNGVQYGVVSTGDPCGVGTPDIYASVYAYRRWIRYYTGV